MTVKVADKAWIAAALLHRENPNATDFPAQEIRQRAEREFGASDTTKSIWYHILTHCVAGKRANPGNYRMLHQTGRGRRRLFRTGDSIHRDRKGKQVPFREDIPERYWNLLDWYESEYNRNDDGARSSDDKNGMPSAPNGSGKNWLRFVGYINKEDLKTMSEAIEQNCEQIIPE